MEAKTGFIVIMLVGFALVVGAMLWAMWCEGRE
jgi:hypothetical protein